jgi:hypothetical protein
MRGLIEYDYAEGKVQIKGFAYWHMLFLLVDWCAFIVSYNSQSRVSTGVWFSILSPAGIAGIANLFQVRKFKKILEVVAEAWSGLKQPNKSLQLTP